MADYVGARHGMAVNSCTTGLHLALVAAGVKPGDEVICPSFSFIATANSILYAGATPVFVDIDPRTYNIDVDLIEAAITPRTTAIMPVSQIGLAADLDRVNRDRGAPWPRASSRTLRRRSAPRSATASSDRSASSPASASTPARF